ncbi:hypothetical protein BKA58DRAFT_172572 [Alternaria rosae]|uniref:uncharacterized protein n=1 Tax=Alternaria rosae TaxID=1187941 RepID=UPI001E8E9118|nr:uncharacterized protein BKA58DRAFT_172572 [Alternaria rosae]KAH6870198.1 hypothetical protein BKA58DRAFT_172572 [Alternaria rosae]
MSLLRRLSLTLLQSIVLGSIPSHVRALSTVTSRSFLPRTFSGRPFTLKRHGLPGRHTWICKRIIQAKRHTIAVIPFRQLHSCAASTGIHWHPLSRPTEPRPLGLWNITRRGTTHIWQYYLNFVLGCRPEQHTHTAKGYSHVLPFQSNLHAKFHLGLAAHAFDQKDLKRQTSSLVIRCRHWYHDHGTSRVWSVCKREYYTIDVGWLCVDLVVS